MYANITYVHACYRGAGAHLYCSEPFQCSNQENGKTLRLHLSFFSVVISLFHCVIALYTKTTNVLLNERVADAVLRVSNIASVRLGSEQVELVQTGSCRFLPQVSQLAEAWVTSKHSSSSSISSVWQFYSYFTHPWNNSSRQSVFESIKICNTCFPALKSWLIGK